MMKLTTRERLLAGIVVTDGGCWEWQRAKSVGYGRIKANGRLDLVHRVAYETFVGPIPDGLDLDHLCRNRACCNPNHLEPVTRQENMRRAFAIRSHCQHGHPLTGSNIVVIRGSRLCHACKNNRQQEWRSRKAVA